MIRSRLPVFLLALVLTACTPETPPQSADPAPLPVKVVVVTMFEIGADSGDKAAEFQLWHERHPLPQRMAFAHHHDLFYNPQTGVLGMVTGVGTAKSASAVMALGLDPRFDLSRAYWLVAGIAGIDPEDGAIGSAVWAEWLVDGDLAHEIDARETPADWPDGYFALSTASPLDPPPTQPSGEVFRLNPGLTEWAYQLTRQIDLGDSDALQQARAGYTGYPKAQHAPQVMKGDNLAAMTYWHGERLNDWANRWVHYWSGGQGNFVTSAMEDTGTAQALAYLDPTGRVDAQRLMVLRTASNYVVPPNGVSAADNLQAERSSGYSGLEASVEAAYRVGSAVVDELVAEWPRYRDQLPQAAPATAVPAP